ncbi:MAG: hypothetical protein WCD57_07485 [Acidobacteriaceae bacterium]
MQDLRTWYPSIPALSVTRLCVGIFSLYARSANVRIFRAQFSPMVMLNGWGGLYLLSGI